MNLSNKATVQFLETLPDGTIRTINKDSNIITTQVTPVVINNYKLTPYIRSTPRPPQNTTTNANNSLWIRLLILLVLRRIYF